MTGDDYVRDATDNAAMAVQCYYEDDSKKKEEEDCHRLNW